MEFKKQINAREFVRDFRAGMPDALLMDKFKISYRGLQKVLRKLLAVGAISPPELRRRIPSFEDTVTLDLDSLRLEPQETLNCLVPVYDEDHPEVRGSLCDIADNAITVSGIEASVGEIRRILVHCRDFFQVDSFALEVQCRWSTGDPPGQNVMTAFEIIEVMEEARPCLTELVRLVRLESH